MQRELESQLNEPLSSSGGKAAPARRRTGQQLLGADQPVADQEFHVGQAGDIRVDPLIWREFLVRRNLCGAHQHGKRPAHQQAVLGYRVQPQPDIAWTDNSAASRRPSECRQAPTSPNSRARATNQSRCSSTENRVSSGVQLQNLPRQFLDQQRDRRRQVEEPIFRILSCWPAAVHGHHKVHRLHAAARIHRNREFPVHKCRHQAAAEILRSVRCAERQLQRNGTCLLDLQNGGPRMQREGVLEQIGITGLTMIKIVDEVPGEEMAHTDDPSDTLRKPALRLLDGGDDGRYLFLRTGVGRPSFVPDPGTGEAIGDHQANGVVRPVRHFCARQTRQEQRAGLHAGVFPAEAAVQQLLVLPNSARAYFAAIACSSSRSTSFRPPSEESLAVTRSVRPAFRSAREPRIAHRTGLPAADSVGCSPSSAASAVDCSRARTRAAKSSPCWLDTVSGSSGNSAAAPKASGLRCRQSAIASGSCRATPAIVIRLSRIVARCRRQPGARTIGRSTTSAARADDSNAQPR